LKATTPIGGQHSAPIDIQEANRGQAAAAFKPLQDTLSDFVFGRGGAEAAGLFPTLASDLADAQRAMWTVRDFEASLIDFGTARWDARRVEALVTRITISLENRTLGKYRDDCLVVGYLHDTEFRVQRDAFEFSCFDEKSRLASWRSGSDFESMWLVPSD